MQANSTKINAPDNGTNSVALHFQAVSQEIS